tara:strand:+ start:104 stop:298 length:195 start_codon:yes stop_codon:yes gene_type:complete
MDITDKDRLLVYELARFAMREDAVYTYTGRYIRRHLDITPDEAGKVTAYIDDRIDELTKGGRDE